MGFFEIFIAVLVVIGVIVVACGVATGLVVVYLMLTDTLHDDYPRTMVVIDGAALVVLIALGITCLAYFGQ